MVDEEKGPEPTTIVNGRLRLKDSFDNIPFIDASTTSSLNDLSSSKKRQSLAFWTFLFFLFLSIVLFYDVLLYFVFPSFNCSIFFLTCYLNFFN